MRWLITKGRILILIVVFNIAQPACSQSAADPFEKLIEDIDSTIILNKISIPEEAFPFFSISLPGDSSTRSMTWVKCRDYSIGIGFRLFPFEANGNLQDCVVMVYSHLSKKAIFLFHSNESDISCREYVGISEIVPFVIHGIIIDDHFNHVGDLDTQFYLLNNYPNVTMIRNPIDMGKEECRVLITDAAKYNGKSYLLAYRKTLTDFIQMIFDVYNKPNHNQTWTNYNGKNEIVKFLETKKKK